jgi:hypothetical protein
MRPYRRSESGSIAVVTLILAVSIILVMSALIAAYAAKRATLADAADAMTVTRAQGDLSACLHAYAVAYLQSGATRPNLAGALSYLTATAPSSDLSWGTVSTSGGANGELNPFMAAISGSTLTNQATTGSSANALGVIPSAATYCELVQPVSLSLLGTRPRTVARNIVYQVVSPSQFGYLNIGTGTTPTSISRFTGVVGQLSGGLGPSITAAAVDGNLFNDCHGLVSAIITASSTMTPEDGVSYSPAYAATGGHTVLNVASMPPSLEIDTSSTAGALVIEGSSVQVSSTPYVLLTDCAVIIHGTNNQPLIVIFSPSAASPGASVWSASVTAGATSVVSGTTATPMAWNGVFIQPGSSSAFPVNAEPTWNENWTGESLVVNGGFSVSGVFSVGLVNSSFSLVAQVPGSTSEAQYDTFMASANQPMRVVQEIER